ncbi:MAG: hypothetical protein ACK4SA_25850 [Caldilinea sp.]
MTKVQIAFIAAIVSAAFWVDVFAGPTTKLAVMLGCLAALFVGAKIVQYRIDR